MGVVSLTGNDTVIINGRVIIDVPDGDVTALTYPNELVNLKIGKNGNTIYAFNNSGRECDATIRVIRGSDDDKFLLDQLATMGRDFASFVLITGSFVKRVGDGQGNVARDVYNLSGGVIVKTPEAKENADGDVEQSVSVYNLKFNNAPRSIG